MLSIIVWLGIPIAVFLGGLIRAARDKYDYTEGPMVVGIALLLFVGLLPIAVNRVEVAGKVAEFKTIKQTVEAYRLREGRKRYMHYERFGHERFGLAQKVAEVNGWLGRTKYWAGMRIFDIHFPDEILELEPIQPY